MGDSLPVQGRGCIPSSVDLGIFGTVTDSRGSPLSCAGKPETTWSVSRDGYPQRDSLPIRLAQVASLASASNPLTAARAPKRGTVMEVLRRCYPWVSPGSSRRSFSCRYPPLAQPVDEVARAIPHARATRREDVGQERTYVLHRHVGIVVGPQLRE